MKNVSDIRGKAAASEQPGADPRGVQPQAQGEHSHLLCHVCLIRIRIRKIEQKDWAITTSILQLCLEGALYLS